MSAASSRASPRFEILDGYLGAEDDGLALFVLVALDGAAAQHRLLDAGLARPKRAVRLVVELEGGGLGVCGHDAPALRSAAAAGAEAADRRG